MHFHANQHWPGHHAGLVYGRGVDQHHRDYFRAFPPELISLLLGWVDSCPDCDACLEWEAEKNRNHKKKTNRERSERLQRAGEKSRAASRERKGEMRDWRRVGIHFKWVSEIIEQTVEDESQKPWRSRRASQKVRKGAYYHENITWPAWIHH